MHLARRSRWTLATFIDASTRHLPRDVARCLRGDRSGPGRVPVWRVCRLSTDQLRAPDTLDVALSEPNAAETFHMSHLAFSEWATLAHAGRASCDRWRNI